MPSPRKPRRRPITIKLPADLVDEVRAFAKAEVGRPLYVASLSAFFEQAVRRELQRLRLVLSGALPIDRASGADAGEEPPDEPPPPRHRLNAVPHP